MTNFLDSYRALAPATIDYKKSRSALDRSAGIPTVLMHPERYSDRVSLAAYANLALTLRPRRAAKPVRAKPPNIIAQDEISGTALEFSGSEKLPDTIGSS